VLNKADEADEEDDAEEEQEHGAQVLHDVLRIVPETLVLFF
jgi:hypothetical protein